MPNIRCTVVDLNERRIDAWNSDDLPIFEPDLEKLVKSARDGSADGRRPPNLVFTTDLDAAIARADMVFVSVNTPTKLTGIGAGRASDIQFVEAATRKIAEVSNFDKIIVEKSTVPCRTADSIRDILAANAKSGIHFDVLSNPEFLAEGTAVTNLLDPDRMLIGSVPGTQGDLAARALADVYAQWVPRERIIPMSLWSSELAKLAANAMLGQRISSMNTLSAICEATGAEIDEVSYAVGMDKRIGPHMLKSSVGFGGSCYKKDIYSLVYLADSLNLPEVATYWKSVIDVNEWQKNRFTDRIISNLYSTLSNKKVTVFGFAYKKNTGDTRESAAITIVNSLVAERAKVAIYDPQVKHQQIFQDLHMTNDDAAAVNECVTVYHDSTEACVGSSAVIILTDWDEFKCDELPLRGSTGTETGKENFKTETLDETSRSDRATSLERKRVDWGRISRTMKKPMFVFDGRNMVDGTKLCELGFRVECIGNARLWDQ